MASNLVSRCLPMCQLTCYIITRGLAAKKLPILTLYTKDNCSLCDEALEVLKPHSHLYYLEEVDITRQEHKEWLKKYQYDIPVFHLDGEFLMKHRADVRTLLLALARKNV